MGQVNRIGETGKNTEASPGQKATNDTSVLGETQPNHESKHTGPNCTVQREQNSRPERIIRLAVKPRNSAVHAEQVATKADQPQKIFGALLKKYYLIPQPLFQDNFYRFEHSTVEIGILNVSSENEANEKYIGVIPWFVKEFDKITWSAILVKEVTVKWDLPIIKHYLNIVLYNYFFDVITDPGGSF